MGNILRRKYIAVDWGAYSFSRRKWRHRHNRGVHNHYWQFGPLEVTVWYR